MSLEIHQLFDKIDKVPQVPEVVRTLVTQVNASNVSFSSIAETVEKEQIISLKVLRLVNSAHYSFPRKIGSIQQALVILGMDELKKLVITSGFINSYSNIEGMSLDDFWIDRVFNQLKGFFFRFIGTGKGMWTYLLLIMNLA